MLTVYGDFNCPFSALASLRAGYLEQSGLETVDWRAVEHSPDIPPEGRPVTGQVHDDLRHELDQVRGLLVADEPDLLRLPSMVPNTARATAAFAATPPGDRSELRHRLFSAVWRADTNIADDSILATLVSPSTADASLAAEWGDEWQRISTGIVPVLVVEDGTVLRGLDGLAHLAELVVSARSGSGAVAGPEGGEAACYAHLFDS